MARRQYPALAMLKKRGEILAGTFWAASAAVLLLGSTSSAASAQQQPAACVPPAALQFTAYDEPMTFSWATTKGNMSTSVWIAAAGVITPDTPEKFLAFLEREGAARGGVQLVLHSPGGNLAAGLELGRIIRRAGLTTHVGRTVRTFPDEGRSCDGWYDDVESGRCASSCAYAFLGGEVRFVDSPYYPTDGSKLGFHQFYGGFDGEADLVTAEEAAKIRASTLSLAQAITGQILMYAVDMGIDPRIVAFASATPSDGLYFPTADEIAELKIASGSGLQPWFMEPHNEGLVTVARPSRSDSMLQQITMFCLDNAQANMLITMSLKTPSYPNPDDLPLTGVEIAIDGYLYSIPRHRLDVRYSGDTIMIRAPMVGLTDLITRAQQVEFSLEAARVMGNFREGNDLDETARKSIALAWRNCI